MKNFIFNLEDFKACALTISLRNRIDKFGNKLVDKVYIDYAKAYLSAWFKAIHRRAKTMIGNYVCRILLVWQEIKEASTKIVEKIKGVLCPKTLQKLIKQERLQDKREFEGYVIRPRIKRHYDRHESKFPRQSVQYSTKLSAEN